MNISILQILTTENVRLKKENEELIKEIRKNSGDYSLLQTKSNNQDIKIFDLEQENKKLKEENELLKGKVQSLEKSVESLQQEIEYQKKNYNCWRFNKNI